MKNAIYDTSLTDAQWAYLKPMLPKPARRGRPPMDRRRIIDAILHMVKLVLQKKNRRAAAAYSNSQRRPVNCRSFNADGGSGA
ncbi:MAG: putative transposase of family [Pedosphaera sp.]|nr:putative transposase of family [Pedosphaera sp.]